MSGLKMVAELMAISARTAPKSAGRDFVVVEIIEGEQVQALAEKKFPDDPAARHQWLQAQLAIMTGQEAPQIETGAGVTLGSTKAEVKDAYGEPFDWVDIAGHHWLTYTANKVSVTFFLSEGRVSMIDLRRGYRRQGYELRRDAWQVHFMTKEQRRMRDEWIVGGSIGGEAGGENAAGVEDAASEVEWERD